MSSSSALFRKYGKVAVGVHLCTSAMYFGALYAGVKQGVDIESILSHAGLSLDSLPGGPDSKKQIGDIAVSYAAYKVLTPVRWPTTIALTPLVARRLGNRKSESEKRE